MHPIQSLLAALLVLASAASSTAIAAGTLDRVKSSGKLVMGYGADDRPFSYDDAGKPAGFAIDLCAKVAASLNAAPEFVLVKREDQLGAVAQGKVQLLCEASVPTLTSRREVSYSIPIFASGASAAVRAHAPQRLKDILSGGRPANEPNWRANADQTLKRTTFAFVAHTHTEDEVRSRLQELRLQIKLAPAENYAAGVEMLHSGHADVLFGDRAVLLDAVKRSPSASSLQVLDRLFTQQTVALALPRNDDDFRLAVDTALSRVFDSAELRGIYTKWFGPPNERTLSMFGLASLPK